MAKPLTQAELKRVLSYDSKSGLFTWIIKPSSKVNIGDFAGTVASDGYVKITISRSLYMAHRLAWLYVYGYWPSQTIDHINRIRTDNKINNLRNVPQHINAFNNSAACVYFVKSENRYSVRLWYRDLQLYFGRYKNKDHAAQVATRARSIRNFAYDHEEIKYL